MTDATKTGNSNSTFLKSVFLGGPTAAMVAGTLEVVVFHPIDTMSKRLMSHESRVVGTDGIEATLNRVKAVVGKGQEGAGVKAILANMYRGTKYAVCYKVSQRTVKFAGQPVVKDYLSSNHKSKFDAACGEKRGKQIMEATAGCLVGISEVAFLPFDRMKVLSQTNPEVVKNRSMFNVMMQEGPKKLYAGIGTTAVRNAPGSFLLFGGTAIVKDRVFQLEDYRKATFFQNMVSSTFGACCGVIFTSPIDVVKTRIQNKGFDGKSMSGMQVLSHTLKTEGLSAFYKGLTPKVITTSPKLVFTYTMTEYFVHQLQQFK